MDWRMGAGIARHVIDALRTRAKRAPPDAWHELPRFASGERHHHEGRVRILRLEQQLFATGRLGYQGRSLQTAKDALQRAEIQRNEDVVAVAACYLVLTGTVLSRENNSAVPEALVMASKEPDIRGQAACVEPRCTFWKTDTDGKFSIDLTRIKALKEMINLIVVKPGFVSTVNLIKIDVRAMDATIAPQSVKLSGVAPAAAALGPSQ
jgi:hypothetical protein